MIDTKTHANTDALSRAVAPVFEQLEARRLLAVVAARPADDFVDSIGINIKIAGPNSGQNDTIYANFPEIKRLLDDLNIRHIRDGYLQRDTVKAARLNELANDLGIKATLLMRPDEAGESDFVQELTDVKPALFAIEGPNEPDLAPISPNFNFEGQGFPTGAVLWQEALYAQSKAHPDPQIAALPVLAPSFGLTSEGVVGVTADAQNIHAYSGQGKPRNSFAKLEAYHDVTGGNSEKPIIVTETGYSDGEVVPGQTRPPGLTTGAPEPIEPTEEVVAKYLPRTLLDYWNRGTQRVFLHQLMDLWSINAETPTPPNQPPNQIARLNGSGRESNFGLVDVDGPGSGANVSEKPSFYAVKNLIDLLDGAGTGVDPDSLDLTFTGNTADLRYTLLQHKDTNAGEPVFFLGVWIDKPSWDDVNDVVINNPTQSVTINFGGNVDDIGVFDIVNTASNGITGIGGATNQSSFTLNVPDEPIFLKLANPTLAQPQTSYSLDVAGLGEGDGTPTTFNGSNVADTFPVHFNDTRIGDLDAGEGNPNIKKSYRSVFIFDLPELGAGQTVQSVDFSASLFTGPGSPDVPVEVIVYDPDDSTVFGEDWGDTDGAVDVGNFVGANASNGRYTIGNTALRNQVQAIYNAGGRQVALRLQMANGATSVGSPTGNDFYSIASSENPTAANRPKLDLTLTPVTGGGTTVTANTTGPDGDGFIVAVPNYNTGDRAVKQFNDARVGDDENIDEAYRAVFKFDLPPLPAGREIDNVTLDFDVLYRTGQPDKDLVASVYRTGNPDLVTGDWNANNQILGFGKVWDKDDTNGPLSIERNQLDTWIRNAYLDGQNQFAVRFQLAQNQKVNGDGNADFFGIATGENPNANLRPKLTITTKPITPNVAFSTTFEAENTGGLSTNTNANNVWLSQSGQGASGNYIRWKGTNRWSPNGPTLTYTFNAPQTGAYAIDLKVDTANSGGNDSVWMYLPMVSRTQSTNLNPLTSGWLKFNDMVKSNNFTWDRAHNTDASNNAVTFYLPEGEHKLQLKPRENDTLIDQIRVRYIGPVGPALMAPMPNVAGANPARSLFAREPLDGDGSSVWTEFLASRT